MPTKRNTHPPLVVVTTRAPRPLLAEFRRIAKANHRSVAAELLRMIEQRVAEDEA